MKLSPLSDLVKPDRTIFLSSLAAALLTVLAAGLIVRWTDDEQQRMDRFGEAAARALAALAADPMTQGDRLHLAVIGNRLADTAEIRGVASYTSDDQILASTGDLRRPHYSRPVAVDDAMVGYVRVAVDPAAFHSEHRLRWAAWFSAALLAALTATTSAAFLSAWRSGRFDSLRAARRRAHTLNGRSADQDASDATSLPAPVSDVSHFLLAVNFYNQLTLPSSEREFEQSLCVELAESVANIYHGQVVTLPGVGILVDLDHTDDPDRPTQIVCAAFVLARLLHDESPFGTYRLGLNLTVRAADQPLPLDDDAVADAALLSALAKDLTLAVSQPFAAALGEGQCVATQPLVNPLLDELTTSNAGCHLITRLEGHLVALVEQQIARLRGQRDATSSPSTF